MRALENPKEDDVPRRGRDSMIPELRRVPNMHERHNNAVGCTPGNVPPTRRDPYDDKLLPMFYCADNVAEGKAAAKAELRKRLNMGHKDVPVVRGRLRRMGGLKSCPKAVSLRRTLGVVISTSELCCLVVLRPATRRLVSCPASRGRRASTS